MDDIIVVWLTGTELNEGLQMGSSYQKTGNLGVIHRVVLGDVRLFASHIGWLTDVVVKSRDHQMSPLVKSLSHLMEDGE